MALRTKTISGRRYYYIDLSYSVFNGSKTFSRYVGVKKPSSARASAIERSFKSEIAVRVAGRRCGVKLITKDDMIRSFLFRNAFNSVFSSLPAAQKRRYEIENTIRFALTTLTTEDVEVDLRDVQNAFEKSGRLSARERISKNMLKAIESIKEKRPLDKNHLLELHRTIMVGFEGKTPGRMRKKQVYLRVQNAENPFGKEIGYRPPNPAALNGLIDQFVTWYASTDLNPVEKAALAHYKLYRIHPFLDGNKRMCRLILNKTLLDAGFPLLNISEKKERYFQSLISAVESAAPKGLAEFILKELFRQTKEFLTVHGAPAPRRRVPP